MQPPGEPIERGESTNLDETFPGHRQMKIGLTVFFPAMFTLALVILVRNGPLRRQHEYSAPPQCAGNLRQIGQALLLYSRDHRGKLPPSLDILLRIEAVESDVFVCPSSNHTPASGKSPLERATSLTLGGHCSYVYVPGTTWAHTSEAVVAYEYSDYHAVTSPAGSIFVLFADGHVELINKRSADFMRAELAKGQNPPRWEQIGGVK